MNTPTPQEDTLDEDLRNRVLLYWSGELDDADAREIESQLEVNPALQTYLREMESMATAVDQVYPGVKAPAHASRTAVERYSASEDLPTNGGKMIFPSWGKPLAAIAAIIMICLVAYQWMMNDTKNKTPLMTEQNHPALNENDLHITQVGVAPIKGMTRSSRLFSSQIRGASSRLDATRLKLNKLRTKIHKS